MSIENVKETSWSFKNNFKTFFEHVLSSKMGRGVLAVPAARAGRIFDIKSVQIIFFQCLEY